MAINKVVYGNDTLIDITDTTATASDVASGTYFYSASGVKTLGTASGSSIDLSDFLAPEYSTTQTYNTNNIVVYDNKMYICTQDNTSGTWNSTYWDEITVSNLFGDWNYVGEWTGDTPVNVSIVLETILNYYIPNLIGAYIYSSNSTYAIGDYVIYQDDLYVCNTAVTTAEAFDSNKWSLTSITEMIGDTESLLGGI